MPFNPPAIRFHLWTRLLLAHCLIFVAIYAAPRDRITRPIDTNQRKAVPNTRQRLASPQNDRGPVDSAMPLNYMVLAFKPSQAQQTNLESLLFEQQNPASSNFHKWLIPSEFGERFGLSSSDHAKVSQWLAAEGFTVTETSAGRNWIAFRGSAGQVSRSLHTSIHRFQVNGETHYANTDDPMLPDAIADVISGLFGLNDFRLKSSARVAAPNYTSGSSHYLAPEDFSTIYNLAPLQSSGLDGTGQSIAVVGDTNIVLSDLRAFKTRFNLPANDPKVVFYGGTNPGVNDDLLESNLDLEWAGALAPKASLYYFYGQDVFMALTAAVNQNVAKIITVSYGGCESDFPAPYYRSVAQQANAQGITIMVATGDVGAAGCDFGSGEPQAAHGNQIQFPAALPEVTAVGGTQFMEGNGTYWRNSNSANGGSALSYIPEIAWDESDDTQPTSGGGGASRLYPRPAWQRAPGVPEGNVRYIPDVSLSAAGHDAYLVYYQGGLTGVYGTSAAAPSLAGIVALLNQFLINNGSAQQPGLGNINPQLYRLFQAAPSAFHDITVGSNVVGCVQGSLDCLTGFIGYQAAPGYDLATGLGSLDVATLANLWNTTGKNVTAALSLSSAKVTLNDSVTATLTVNSTDSAPTGTVDFSVAGISFGSVPLTARSATTSLATLSIPVGRLAIGSFTISAQYSGDAVFNGGGATATVQIIAPPNASAIILSGPVQVLPATPPDVQGLVYQTTLTLREAGGVPAVVTAFTIDGKAQSLSQYLPMTAIPANGSLTITVKLKDLVPPTTKTFGFTGIDASGIVWNREITVTYFPIPRFGDFSITAFPTTVSQDTRNTACQWPVRLSIDDVGGFATTIEGLYVGSVSYTSQIAQIFGTPRLQALSSLQGTLCLNDLTVPGTATIEVDLANGDARQITVSFSGPAQNPGTLSVTPSSASLVAAVGQTASASLGVNLSDRTQPWNAIVTPANRTAGWLTTSPLSGIGPGQIILTASGVGYEPGVYHATVYVQSATALPQVIAVPVVFVYSGSGVGTMITGVGNAFSPAQPLLSPGMLLSIVGSNLAATNRAVGTNPLPFVIDGVSAQVNGIEAPVLFASPHQLNIQVPYDAGAGPGVIGVNNNGQVAGYPVQIVPAAPGIYTDADGVLPTRTVNQDGVLTLYLTGAGEVSTLIETGAAPGTKTLAANLPLPVLPLQATVGGYPVFVQFAGIGAGLVGITQVNLIVPESVPMGVQDVVVTINGVPSNRAKVMVLAPK